MFDRAGIAANFKDGVGITFAWCHLVDVFVGVVGGGGYGRYLNWERL